MHPAAYNYVGQFASQAKTGVIEIGSRNINGTVKDHFPNAAPYIGVDILDGPGVDQVADAVSWKPKRKAGVVVCCEMIEHCDDWIDVIENIEANMLTKGGCLILTAAGPARAPHSGFDGGPVQAGEFYENIHPADLEDALRNAGFVQIDVEVKADDIRATAVKA